MEKYKIEYKGRSVETKHYCEVTDEELKQIRDEYFKKPTMEQVKKQMATIAKGGVMNDKITRYFFRELMAKVQVSTAKWSIEEVFESKELTGMFKSKTLANKNVFPETKTLAQNIERAIALGGKAYAQTPTNFPIKTMDQLLEKYNINNNFYDYSCGWGARLTSALKNKVNYFGTDPNYELVDRLYNLTEQEIQYRDERASRIQVTVAGFPFEKEVKDFDFTYQPGINKQQILELESLRFIENNENILFVGSSRSWKNTFSYSNRNSRS